MKKTNFTNLRNSVQSLITLLLVGVCLNLSAQSFSVSNIALGTTSCTTVPGANPLAQYNIPINVTGLSASSTLASVTLNYCSPFWTGDWSFFLAAPGSNTAFRLTQGSGYGSTNSSNSLQVFDLHACSAPLYGGTIGFGRNGDVKASIKMACPTTATANGTWVLVALNTFAGFSFDEAGFLSLASLNFSPAPTVVPPTLTGVTANAGSVISQTGPVFAGGVNTNCVDTFKFTVVCTGGSTGINATVGAPTASGSTTNVTNISAVAGPYGVGTYPIRVDEACYNPSRRFVTMLTVIAPPQINCPAPLVKTLAPGECTNQVAFPCVTSSVGSGASGGTRVRFSQQTVLAPINNAWRCVPLGSGNINRFGRIYDAVPTVAADPCNPAANSLVIDSVTVGAWSNPSNGLWGFRVFEYTGVAPVGNATPALVYPGNPGANLIQVGTSNVTMPTTTNTQVGILKRALVTPIVIQRGKVYYAEIISSGTSAAGGAGYWEIGSNTNPQTRGCYTSSTLCQANPTAGFSGGTVINVPLDLHLGAATSPIVQTSGPKLDDLVGPGTYNLCFQVTDATGTTATCCFTYEVRPYSGPISNSLVCNDFLNVSLDTLCSAVIGADMVLEGGPYKCYDNYKVEIATTMSGPWRDNMGCVGLVPQAFNNNKVTLCAGAIGKTYFYRVTDKANQSNVCWGQLKVEDKVPPVIVCPANQTINCNDSTEPGNQPQGAVCSASVSASGASAAAPVNIPIVVNLPFNSVIESYTFSVINTGSAWTGDQRAELISPTGQRIRLNGDQLVLANNVGVGPGAFGCANTGSNVTYSNASTLSPAALTCANPVVGTCKPIDALPAFVGPSVCGFPVYGSAFNGTWTLRVWDDFPGDALGSMQGCFNFAPSGTSLPNGLLVGTFAEYSDPTTGVNAYKIGDKKYRVKAGLVDVCSEATLTYNDVVQEFPCTAATQIIKIITRKWSAEDASGNKATCTQTISVRRADINNLSFPLSWDGQPGQNRRLNICSDFYSGNPNDYSHGDMKWVKLANGYPSPKAGVNAVDTIYVGEFDPFHDPLNPGTDTLCLKGTGMPSGATCGTINMLYTDTKFDQCGGGANAGYKLLRDWRVLDWCTGQIRNVTQTIVVIDQTAPTIVCPANLTASTDALVCSASGTFPAPVINDICSATTYEVYYRGGAAFPDGATIGLNPDGSWRYNGFPCGTYNFKYIAKDECNNIDSCTGFNLIIRDLTVPVPVCRSLSQVTLSNTPDDPFTTAKECGLTRVEAYKFDEGSWDNCGQVYFKARRGNTFTPGIYDNDPRFDDYVWFNCEDVGKDIDVILRVYDVQPLNGHVGSVSDRGDSYRPTRTDGCGPLGNFNDCIVKVRVEDLVNPTIVCPPSINITCTAYDFSIPLTNADTSWFNKYFGRIITNDCNGVNNTGTFTYYNGSFQVTAPNGSAFDNCFVTLPQTITAQLECGVGTITRTFRAVDRGGRQSAPCTQLIIVTNPSPFRIDPSHYTDPGSDLADPCDGAERIRLQANEDFVNDLYVSPNFTPDNIIWPDKVVELTSCSGIDGIGTECANTGKDAGRPRILRNDKCDLVAITFTDETFPIAPPACIKILRTWRVIDWCQNKPTGRIWTYTQIIKLVNKVAPEFTGNTCKNDTICQYPSDCGPDPLTLCATATDDCTPADQLKYSFFIDVDNNGTNDVGGTGSCVTLTKALGLKYGRHMITWGVEDNCGNVKTCSKIFIVKDCKKPTPVAKLLAIELMPNNCQATLEAVKVNNFSWDNCTPMANLRFRLAKAGEYKADMTLAEVLALNDYVVFGAGEVGTQPFALIVIDADNNWDYVETFVVVQSNMNPDCVGGTGTAPVSGSIQTEAKENVDKVDVLVNGTNRSTTDAQGFFNFLLGLYKTYTVAPEKLIEPRNGVTTADLVAINKHILGIENLTSPYKRIAADINNDGKISTADMVELRKLILFINDNFTTNTSWKMVDKKYNFATTTPEKESYPLNVTINPLSSAAAANFVAVKVGDVNGSAKANNLVGDASDRSAGTLVFDVTDATLVAGETKTVEFKAQDIANINAYQFTMNFDKEALEVVSVAGLNESNFGLSLLSEGVITTSNDAVAADQVIAVTFKAKKATQLSNALSIGSRFTAAEAYTVNGDKFDVAISFNGTIAGDFQLLQNQPNPFNGKTVIGFVFPEASNATLTIFDATGRTLKVITGSFAKGYNEVVIEKSDVNTVGILSYRLTTDKFSSTKQMIIAE